MNADASIRAVSVGKAEPPLQSGADDNANSRAAANAERQARYRLVIEQGSRAGTFVYKTLDRETGEVVSQFPSEKLLEMTERPDYDVGTVINTTV